MGQLLSVVLLFIFPLPTPSGTPSNLEGECIYRYYFICFSMSILGLVGVADNVQGNKFYVVETKIYNYTALGII